jgi:4-carboxymuconolactone decarboxylase
VGALSPAQRRVHDAIAAGPRRVVAGPLAVWLESPELASRAQELGTFCRYNSSLPRRLSELAILVTAAHWEAGYEWHVHAPLAIAAGVDPAAVDAIRAGEDPPLGRPDERAIYDFARELLDTSRVSDETYRRGLAHLGRRGVVELVGILGYYALISMTICAFEVPVPEGAAEPFPES